MPKEVDVAAIDEESIEMIEQHVKKGKARKFFMIYKGASIKTIGVFKKGPFGPRIMKAKKSGFKGDVAYGIVTGSGKNLFFQLPGNGEVAAAMEVDSWEEAPPTKATKLKEFLKDNGMSFKPSYHIITNPSTAPNANSENDVPVAPPPPGSSVEEDDVAEPSVSDETADELGAAFQTRLKKMAPLIQKASASDSPQKSDLVENITVARRQAASGDYAEGNRSLDQAVEVLKAILAGSSAPSVVSDTPESAVKFKATLTKLAPHIKAALATESSAVNQLKEKVAEAKQLGTTKRFDEGLDTLREIGALIKTALSGADSSDQAGAVDNTLQRDWESRLKGLQPEIDEVLGSDASVNSDLKLRVSETKTYARKSDFMNAHRILDKIEGILEIAFEELGLIPEEELALAELFGDDYAELFEPDPPEPKPVEPLSDEQLLKLMEESSDDPLQSISFGGRSIWETAKNGVFDQLIKLESAMRESSDPDLPRISRICRESITDNFNIGLRDALEQLDQASPNDLPDARKVATAAIEKYQSYLSNDTLVQLCDNNALGVNVSIRGTLESAMNRLSRAISTIE